LVALDEADKEEIQTSGLIKNLFIESVKKRLPQHPALVAELEKGLPPLGNHDEMLAFVNGINRDVSAGVVDAFSGSLERASLVGLFDAIGAGLAQQFVLSPYYFALFHQNKERRLLPGITRQDVRRRGSDLKVALFTDTFDDINGVGRFIRDMGRLATDAGRDFTVCTSTPTPDLKFSEADAPFRRNFAPLVSRPMPLYEELKVNIPPVLEVLEWCDRQQFDVIHVSTPGPMGLVGLLAAKMLRVPVLATYHTDFPAYIEKLTGDHRQAGNVAMFMKWFYKVPDAVFTRSSAYRFKLADLGIEDDEVHQIKLGIDLDKFNPQKADDGVLKSVGVDTARTPHVLMYAGRVSVEKNLPMLTKAFKALCAVRSDVALVVAGDGPYRDQMQEELAGTPAYFPGYCDDAKLAALYGASTLFVFPSRTDTLGQVVMEAQACGLPCLVGPDGGPKETIVDRETGLVLPAQDPAAWCDAIDKLLNQPSRLENFRIASAARGLDFSIAASFETFWDTHAVVGDPPRPDDPRIPAPIPEGADV
ncbi:MAG: glycosyltransferase family 1 protein, partial [Planctomycetota bacterium]